MWFLVIRSRESFQVMMIPRSSFFGDPDLGTPTMNERKYTTFNRNGRDAEEEANRFGRSRKSFSLSLCFRSGSWLKL